MVRRSSTFRYGVCMKLRSSRHLTVQGKRGSERTRPAMICRQERLRRCLRVLGCYHKRLGVLCNWLIIANTMNSIVSRQLTDLPFIASSSSSFIINIVPTFSLSLPARRLLAVGDAKVQLTRHPPTWRAPKRWKSTSPILEDYLPPSITAPRCWCNYAGARLVVQSFRICLLPFAICNVYSVVDHP